MKEWCGKVRISSTNNLWTNVGCVLNCLRVSLFGS